jgi:hypothetical protein
MGCRGGRCSRPRVLKPGMRWTSCDFQTTPQADGTYEHRCTRCGIVRIVKNARLHRKCDTAIPIEGEP